MTNDGSPQGAALAESEPGPVPDDVQGFLAAVEARLLRLVDQVDHELLRCAAQHLCFGDGASGAKRARPQLVWAFGRCLEPALDPAELCQVAVAAELIHSGSLLHDDVVDQGQSRRGRVTANVRYGNAAAVLAGDMLLTQALLGLPGRPGLLQSAVETVAQMTVAAMGEVEGRGRLDLSLSHWRAIAAGKTGALFAWCGRAVGQLAGDERAARVLARCGCRLGVAFQLADDLLDLSGQKEGKDRFADLRNRELSYPILAAAAASPALRAEIEQLWQAGCPAAQTAALSERLLQSAAVARAVRDAEEQLDLAQEALGDYRQRPGGLLIAGWIGLLRQRLPHAGQAPSAERERPARPA